jgi:hypothetical protein
MKRIIESYVNFIGIGRDSWAAILDENKEVPDYYIKCAFISMINDESHKVSVLDDAYFQKLSTEQPLTLFNVFKEIFKAIGRKYYELMMDEELLLEIVH